MTEKEIEKSMVSIDFDKEPEYTLKMLAKDFPQIFRANGTIKRSTLRKKYTLREAMLHLGNTQQMVRNLRDLEESPSLNIFTRSGSIRIVDNAADYICNQMDDVFIDMIEAGWQFQVI